MNSQNEKTEEKKQPKDENYEEFPKWRFGKPFGILNKREKILKNSMKKD